MDGYQITNSLFTNESIGLRVFLAMNTANDKEVIVKQFVCCSYEDSDVLLKEAVALAHQQPTCALLTTVILYRHTEFSVNFIFERLVPTFPRAFIEKNERDGGHTPGLALYRLGNTIFERGGEIVYEAVKRDTEQPLIVKASRVMMEVAEANDVIKEAIVQAHTFHAHNVNLFDIALVLEQIGFRVGLVLEKLDKDVSTDIEQRKVRNRPYSENELLCFLKQVTLGLVHAKSKVNYIQNIAHRDISPCAIFVTTDGNFKVGDFGAALSKRNTRRREATEQSEVETIRSGRVRFRSPEMSLSLSERSVKIDSLASDVFSLGVTFLELASLRVPISLNTVDRELLSGEVDEATNSVPISAFLKSVLRRMLSFDPADRPSLEELLKSVCDELREDESITHLDLLTDNQLADEEKRIKHEIKIIFAKKEGKTLELASKYRRLGLVFRAQKKNSSSAEYLQASAKILDSLQEPAQAADTYSMLGSIYNESSRFAEAEQTIRKALKINIELRGDNHSEVAKSYDILAAACSGLGRLSEAAEYWSKSLEMCECLLGEFHPEIMKKCCNLAKIYERLGQFSDSERLLLKSLSICKVTHGETHSAFLYKDLASIYEQSGRSAEAANCTQEALRIDSLNFEDTRLHLSLPNIDSPAHLEDSSFKTTAEDAFELNMSNTDSDHFKTIGDLLKSARLLSNQGRFTEATEQFQQALKMSLGTFGESHPVTVMCYTVIASIYKEIEHLEEAAEYAYKAITVFTTHYGKDHPKTGTSYNNYAIICKEIGRLQEAVECSRESIRISIATHGDSHPETAIRYSNLAVIYKEMGMLPEAGELCQRAIKILLANKGEKRSDIASAYNNLAMVYHSAGQPTDAATYILESIRISIAIYGENHPKLAMIYNNYASICTDLHQIAEAENYQLKSIQITIAHHGENHSEVATGYNNLAVLYQHTGRLSEASELSQKALRISISIFGENHLKVAHIYNNYASICKDSGQFAEAENYLLKSIQISIAHHGENHSDIATRYNNLAVLYQNAGRLSEASEYYQKSFINIISVSGESNPKIATIYNNYALICKGLGRMDEAELYLQKAISVRLTLQGESNPDIAICYSNLSILYVDSKRFAEAEDCCQKAVRIATATLGENHSHTISYLEILAAIYHELKQTALAAESAQRALRLGLANFGENHEKMASIFELSGLISCDMGQYAEAAEYFSKEIRIITAHRGETDSSLAQKYNFLSVMYAKIGKIPEAAECSEKAWQIAMTKFGEYHHITAEIRKNWEMIDHMRNGI